jgi:hypothetical protein
MPKDQINPNRMAEAGVVKWRVPDLRAAPRRPLHRPDAIAAHEEPPGHRDVDRRSLGTEHKKAADERGNPYP